MQPTGQLCPSLENAEVLPELIERRTERATEWQLRMFDWERRAYLRVLPPSYCEYGAHSEGDLSCSQDGMPSPTPEPP